MKVYLTGQTGFIGKNLLKRFQDDEVYCYKRDENVNNTLTKFQPDVIIHCAGEIYKDGEMFASNVELTYELLIYSIKIPYTSFVYIGSSSEYGRKSLPMEEDDFLDPTNLYEATKGCGTLLCQAIARQFDKPISIARPFSVYGPEDPAHRFIPTIIRCLKNNKTLKVAPGVHDYIHVEDFVNGVVKLIEKPQKGEVFNFGSGVQYSNEEVVQRIERLAKKSIKKEFIGKMKPYDTDNWVANTDKAKKLLDWHITKSFSDGLSELL